MKYILAVLVAGFFAIFLFLAYTDFRYFQPIAQKYNKAIPYPYSVSKLLDTEYGQSLKYLVARELLKEVGTSRAIKGHINIYIWGCFTELHLSHDEQVNVIVSSVYLGTGTYGFSGAASKFYNKILLELSPKEVALLVEQIRAPSYYNKYPEKLKKRANNLLKRAGYAS